MNKTLKQYTFNDHIIEYYEYTQLNYCKKEDQHQLNIYTPVKEDLSKTPIILPLQYRYFKETMIEPMNELFASFIEQGYIVVSPYIGAGAPTFIIDLKATIRYLRTLNIGDTEKIIVGGIGSGALASNLLATTGNHPDYLPYLEAISAYNARDDIYATISYGAVMNLEHADEAYEWEFNYLDSYVYRQRDEEFIAMEYIELTDEQLKISDELKKNFEDYYQSLNILENGEPLSIDDFKYYLADFIIESAIDALNNGKDLKNLPFISVIDGRIVGFDYSGFIQYRTRMKPVPAFDSLNSKTMENQLFNHQHFTNYSFNLKQDESQLIDQSIVKLCNPMAYIHDSYSVKALHYRIRHGALDRDSSIVTSALFTLELEKAGLDVNLYYPWDEIHTGWNDLSSLLPWIDTITKEN